MVVGKDTRISGYMLETAIASGVCALGGRVLICGPTPTPAVAHLTTTMRADVGIMISASHNVYEDNGIKIFGHDGYKLPDEIEADIEREIGGRDIDQKRPTGRLVGTAERIDDSGGRYIAFTKSTFPSHLTLEGLKIVVDAAHGAAYKLAPAVFEELGATVYPIAVKPNGHNINDKCGATHPEACIKEVLRRKADIGIALDGDADRVIVVDNKGEIVDGDAIMAMCASRMIKNKSLKKKTLVATVMSNLGLEHALKKQGGKLVRCAVGDRYVVETMRKSGFNLGGEQSGHMIFLDHTTTGDGLVTALQLLAIVCTEERSLSELWKKTMERVPQILVNVKLSERRPIEELPKVKNAIREATQSLGTDGRVLVRWSGTEPKLRVMVEGPNKKTIQKLAKQIAAEATAQLG